MSVLRSVSPIHIEYLQNMGVGASMSVSILRDGAMGTVRLPSLRPAPRLVRAAHRRRTVRPDVLLDSGGPRARGRGRLREPRAQNPGTDDRSRRFARHSSAAIVDFVADYRKMIGCDGIAVWSEEKITLSGETPTEAEVMDSSTSSTGPRQAAFPPAPRSRRSMRPANRSATVLRVSSPCRSRGCRAIA